MAAPRSGAQTADELMTEVRFLADSARQGRGFGTAGACASSFYIFRQFRNAGLRTSFQSFEAAGEAGQELARLAEQGIRVTAGIPARLN